MKLLSTVRGWLVVVGLVGLTDTAWAGSASAAQPSDAQAMMSVEQMTRQQAIALALEHSSKMKEARATVRLATLEVAEARLINQALPTLSLGKRFDTVAPSERLAFAISLDLAKVLGAGREAERAKLKRFNAEVYQESVKAQVIEEVTRAFFAYQLARQTVAVTKVTVEGQKKLENVVRIRFEAGKVDINDLLTVQSAIAKGLLALLQAEQEEQLAALHLRAVIGLPLAEKEKQER